MSDTTDFKEYLGSAYKWAYWIIGLVIVFTISNILYNRFNKQIAALLVFIAGIMALYYYYVKWFIVSELKWPPVVSLCPDNLTVAKVTNTAVYCVDLVGASSNGGIAKLQGNIPANPESDAELASQYIFTVTHDDMKNKANEVCDRTKDKGLTWMTLCEEL